MLYLICIGICGAGAEKAEVMVLSSVYVSELYINCNVSM